MDGEAKNEQQWIDQQHFIDEVRHSGAVIVTSMKPYAEDLGHGTLTVGVNECVAIASEYNLAHIAADSDFNSLEMKQLLKKFKNKTVELFGLQGSELLVQINQKLKQQGTQITNVHALSKNRDISFTVVIKNERIHWFLSVDFDSVSGRGSRS